MKAAFFDFDGTLLRKDLMQVILKNHFGYFKYCQNFLSLGLKAASTYCGMRSRDKFKEDLVDKFLCNQTEEKLFALAQEIAFSERVESLKVKPVLDKLKFHQDEGHLVIIVSANFRTFLQPFAELFKVQHVLATELSFTPGRTRLGSKNCFGEEKVRRIEKFLKQQNLTTSKSYAYGNSRGDKEMLDFADESYWVNKNFQLEKYAKS